MWYCTFYGNCCWYSGCLLISRTTCPFPDTTFPYWRLCDQKAHNVRDMTPNLVWIILKERFFFPNAISFLCYSRGLLPFSPSWTCSRRSFFAFYLCRKEVKVLLFFLWPNKTYTRETLAVVGSQELSFLLSGCSGEKQTSKLWKNEMAINNIWDRKSVV